MPECNLTEWWVVVVVMAGKPRSLAFKDPRHAARYGRRREEPDRSVIPTRTTTAPVKAPDGLWEFPQPRPRYYMSAGQSMHRHRSPRTTATPAGDDD